MLLSKPVKVHEEDEPRIVLRFAVANRDQSRTHFSALGNIAVSCWRNVNAGKIRVKFNVSSIADRSRFYIFVAANFELIDELTNVGHFRRAARASIFITCRVLNIYWVINARIVIWKQSA